MIFCSLIENEKERERGSNLRRQRLASPTAQVLVAQTTRPLGWFKRIGFMASFRATFGLTRSIGGWEEGERRLPFVQLPFSSLSYAGSS